MTITRRRLLAAPAAFAPAALTIPRALRAQEADGPAAETLIGDLIRRDPAITRAALDAIADRGGTDLVSSLIFARRYSRAPGSAFDAALTALTGEPREGWFDWMLWQEANPEVVSHPAYFDFKRRVFLSIDPNFDVFLDPAHIAPGAMRIRFEEVTWGGVAKDGIPSLDTPVMIDAAEADYLLDDDLVFGVEIEGDVRAYPLRIMGWHEMFNDTIGGVPVALAYCTLCGAGILFETAREAAAEPFVFGSSGFLYRSNKLMFDRQTNSLWNQFTGEPVSGELAHSGIVLQQRPVVITEWSRWRDQNPGTTVLALETGHDRDYGSGVVYRDYFASDELMFPALAGGEEHEVKDYVFGVRLAGGAKAWPLEAFAGGRVINDSVGFTNLVLVGDAETRTVRAYDRGELEFDAELNAGGQRWTLTEEALVAPDGARAPRVAGHIAYWFAWSGYLGATAELWAEP
ncbi:DUF3179 domain-containing protein [Rhodobacterales bacterium HKCCE2091]|nr:DUF3179 domain-containing protein [Rhodobacterales bacterium HKCCE2091]